jgi:hypothetical protein
MKKRFMIIVLMIVTVFALSSCNSVFKKGVDYDGFPSKDIPVYEDAIVFSFEADDEEMVIECGTNDDVDDIAGFYSEEFDSDDYTITKLVDTEKDEYECEGIFDDELEFEIEVEESYGKLKEFFDFIITIEIDEADRDSGAKNSENNQNDSAPIIGYWLNTQGAGMDVGEYGGGFYFSESGDAILFNEFEADADIGSWEAVDKNSFDITDPKTGNVYQLILIDDTTATMDADGTELLYEKVNAGMFENTDETSESSLDFSSPEGFWYFVKAGDIDVKDSGSGFELKADGTVDNYNDFEWDGQFEWTLKSDGTIYIYDPYYDEEFTMITNGDGTASMDIDGISMVLEKIDGQIFTGQDTAQVQPEEPSNDSTASYTPTDIDGTPIELDYLTITALDGWNTMDVTNGIQIYKGSQVVQIDLRGFGQSQDQVMKYVEDARDNYGGTDIETINLWGMEFLCTKYDFGGSNQIVYATLFNDEGQMLAVKMIGTESFDVPDDIQKMLGSVVLK